MPLRVMSPDDLLDIQRLGAPSASADGSRVVVPITRADRTANRMVTRLHQWTGGELRPLTGEGASSPQVAPDGSAVAFLREVEGEAQLHLLPLEGAGEATALTDFPHGVVAARWLPDASALLVATPLARCAPTLEETRAFIEQEGAVQHSARTTEARLYRYWDRWLTDERTHHLFVVDRSGGARHVSPGLDAWLALGPMVDPFAQMAVAPDGAIAVISAAAAPHGREGEPPLPRYTLWRLSLGHESPTDQPRVEPLTPSNPAADIQPVFVSPTKVLFGARREADDYAAPPILTLLDLDTGEQRPLTAGWELSPSEWVVDGERALVLAEERARTHLFAVDLGDGSVTRLSSGEGSLGSLVLGGEQLFATHQTLSRPASLVCLPRRSAEPSTPTRLADPNAALVGELDLGPVEELTLAGARGDEVQVFVVHPPGADPAEPERRPLVHMMHGGPHGTFGDVFHYRWNAHAFAAPGYLVALVNFHGSSSFGHESTRSIQGAWGDMPTTDILAATDALIERGLADPERMAITGGSYGGYLAAWIPTRTDRFRCAIAHAAVCDLGAMLATDWTLGLGRSYGADPTEDPERVARWSPSHHWKTHHTPTLVIHGAKDYRVPLQQGLELYGALRSKGVDARLVVYPDENHWVLKPANARHWYGEVHEWLRRHLRL